MNRVLKVARMQFVNKYTFVWMPLIILSTSFAMSLVIFALIPYDGAKYGGGSQAPIWYFFALGIMALSYTFPFSQAMSITRRDFFFGTLLAALFTSIMLGIVFVLGGFAERATRGWGLNGFFFYLDWVWTSGPIMAGVFFAVVALLLFVLGFWGSTVYRRFGALGLTFALAALGLILIAGMWLLGRLNAWESLFSWFGTVGIPGASAVLLGAIVLFGGIAFLSLRRATP